MKKEVILIFALIVLIIQSCSNKTEINLKSRNELKTTTVDTTKYGFSGFNSGVTLGLLSNNNFFYRVELWSCFGGGEEKYVFGKFQKLNNKITLYPEKIKTLEYLDDMDLLDENEEPLNIENPEIKEYSYEMDSTKIKTEYLTITIGYKCYLLSEEKKDEYFSKESKYNDFEELASELKNEDKIYGQYLSRETQDSVEFDLKQIPEKWRKLFE
ncbi:hypothetical protein GCM10009430_49150 [Aquimarina litoralis]|uniref:Lipoprotein n=1 Tax=Aquimarina litoralis TaxID=584605 RepID=A0ABN1JAW4_9FLAO